MPDEQNDPSDPVENPSGDSGIYRQSQEYAGLLQVYSAGEITVVGFCGRDVPRDFWIGGYKDELSNIIREHNCRELAFDLSGVVTVPSGMLGLLSSLNDLGVKISIFNPSSELKEILSLTNLNELIEFRAVTLDE